MENICSFDGCDKIVKSRGLCSAHYERLRKHGSPSTVLPPAPPPTNTLHVTCTIDGCDKPHQARGFCSAHYCKFRKYGDPTTDKRRQRSFCEVDECDRPVHGAGLCRMHWDRWRIHGDPEYTVPVHRECIATDCGKRPRSARLGLCEMHYYRARRHGDIGFVMDTRKAEVLYRAAHQRLVSDHGPARAHMCVDCGKPAAHWSYQHDDPHELMSPSGLPYSLDADHYRPRCLPCHAAFDGWGANQYTR